MRRPLRNNQKEALSYCARVQHPALFMEMRLGKTLVTTRALRMYGARRILVTAPYSAFYGWEKELLLENEMPNGLTILEGTREERQEKLIKGWDDGSKWFLVNKEGHLTIPEMAEYPWDGCVLDESTCIKSHGNRITGFYTRSFRSVDHRFILTGTPAPEGELDYFLQCEFLNPEIFEYDNYWNFKRRCFGTIDYKLLVSPYGSKYIPSRLSKYCFFQTRRDCNMGGVKLYTRRLVALSAQAREIYTTARKKFLLEYKGEIKDSTVFSVTTYNWMRRVCGGLVEKEFIDDGKINELLYLIGGELQGQQVVIWCHYTDEINLVAEHLEENGYNVGVIYGGISQKMRRIYYGEFDAGHIQYLVMQPECFKYGTNLSCCSTMIYYSSPEGLETRLQSEDRVIDVSVTDSKLIIDLVRRGTIEEEIIESLVMKEGKQDMMRRIVKRLQREEVNAT